MKHWGDRCKYCQCFLEFSQGSCKIDFGLIVLKWRLFWCCWNRWGGKSNLIKEEEIFYIWANLGFQMLWNNFWLSPKQVFLIPRQELCQRLGSLSHLVFPSNLTLSLWISHTHGVFCRIVFFFLCVCSLEFSSCSFWDSFIISMILGSRMAWKSRSKWRGSN